MAAVFCLIQTILEAYKYISPSKIAIEAIFLYTKMAGVPVYLVAQWYKKRCFVLYCAYTDMRNQVLTWSKALW